MIPWQVIVVVGTAALIFSVVCLFIFINDHVVSKWGYFVYNTHYGKHDRCTRVRELFWDKVFYKIVERRGGYDDTVYKSIYEG